MKKTIKLESWEVETVKQVKAVLMKKQKGLIISSVKSVAKSGLSRRISFALIKNNDITILDGVFAKLLRLSRNQGRGLLVPGCGMNMIFHTLEQFLQTQGVKDSCRYAENYRLF